MSAEIKPFPFPSGYWLNPLHKLGDRSIRDYINIFETRRNERTGGKFAVADIEEIMRLAEDMGGVDIRELASIEDLILKHPDYFIDDAQKQKLVVFAENHKVLSAARQDDTAKDLVGLVPLSLFRGTNGASFLATTMELSSALSANDAYHRKNDNFDPDLVQKVNRLAGQLRDFVSGLTLSDIDDSGKEARSVFLRDVTNLLARAVGSGIHEARWDGTKWVNWNQDITVYPRGYEEPANREELIALVRRAGPLRMVGGGHAFNNSSSMGGQPNAPIGTLVSLDKYRLAGGELWSRVPAAEATARFKMSPEQAQRVVYASGGIRLRDFGKLMWNEGMALPVAGSTDAQSIAGLIATDLHSTGKYAGFLSSQLLELTVISGTGEAVIFTKDESVPRGKTGRWRFTPPGQTSPQMLAQLPVAGALGMLGVVAEIVLKLDAAYHMQKTQRFVPSSWAEANIERLLDPGEQDPNYAFDHVSFYYTGGGGPIRTIRMNTWKRTTEPLSRGGLETKKFREMFDLVGSGFLPDYLIRVAQREAPIPGQPPPDDEDFWIKTLNSGRSLVLPANEGFARKLFFLHDEIEVGLPLPHKADGKVDFEIFRNAIRETQRLLNEEEFRTIIEVRFTTDLSEAMLGPGTNGPTCYIELATAFGDYSEARIYEVYDAFEGLMRRNFAARPHLGKKTSYKYSDLAATYGATWNEFQAIRRLLDPNDKYLPADNTFLTRLFKG